MNTKEITVNVSKKIGQPNFGSAMLSASITMTIEEETEVSQAYLEGWGKCWEEIDKQEKELKERTEVKEVVESFEEEMVQQHKDPNWIGEATPNSPEPSVSPTTSNIPKCPIHEIALTWRPAGISKRTGKPYAGFYACPDRTNGQFCAYKPK